MKRFRNLLSLLILSVFLLTACENQIDFQHQNDRLNEQLIWETTQRKALQRYIDYVLNARYEANAFGTGRRKVWKIKDPISSADLLAILRGTASQASLPASLEIIELESVNPAPPKAEEMPGTSIIQPIETPLIEDNQANPADTLLPGRPLDSNAAPGAIGNISSLDAAPAAQRVGVSRGLGPANTRTPAVVSGPGNTSGREYLLVAEQQPVKIPLEEALLFGSGSSTINTTGNRVIAALAKKLRSYPNHLIMVEGHTDNVEVSNLGDIKDNWDLSVMRATEVVRALVRAGIPPQNLIASGRGKALPRSSNESQAGRSANRRVEVVLTPWPKP